MATVTVVITLDDGTQVNGQFSTTTTIADVRRSLCPDLEISSHSRKLLESMEIGEFPMKAFDSARRLLLEASPAQSVTVRLRDATSGTEVTLKVKPETAWAQVASTWKKATGLEAGNLSLDGEQLNLKGWVGRRVRVLYVDVVVVGGVKRKTREKVDNRNVTDESDIEWEPDFRKKMRQTPVPVTPARAELNKETPARIETPAAAVKETPIAPARMETPAPAVKETPRAPVVQQKETPAKVTQPIETPRAPVVQQKETPAKATETPARRKSVETPRANTSPGDAIDLADEEKKIPGLVRLNISDAAGKSAKFKVSRNCKVKKIIKRWAEKFPAPGKLEWQLHLEIYSPPLPLESTLPGSSEEVNLFAVCDPPMVTPRSESRNFQEEEISRVINVDDDYDEDEALQIALALSLSMLPVTK